MTGLDLVRWGGQRLRVGPFRGDTRTAYVAPLPEGAPPTTDAVRRCCEVLAGRGFVEAVTAALGPAEAHGFMTAGFEIRERLHLLAHDLLVLPQPPDVALRRAKRADRPGALAVDARAFEPFWRLDDPGLEEALTATPSSRFRVADTGPSGRRSGESRQITGYAVAGRAAHRGFLQRLAVDPDWQGTGTGSALVIDALRWMKRRGVDRAVVNTQERNEGAVRLYERLGFRIQPGGLAVLRIALT
jgi:ribosomal protein S18 acetylase RimI-like enzyme